MKTFVLAASAFLTADAESFCSEKGIVWKKSGGRAKKIATNSQTNAVWIVSTKPHLGGFSVSKLDIPNRKITKDKKAPNGAKHWMGNSLAVDTMGQPAFVDSDKLVHWRRRGKWMQPLPNRGCAYTIAFGGDGSFYMRDCYFNLIHK